MPFSVILILFRPEQLLNSKLNIQLNYTKESTCKEKNDVCVEDIINDQTTKSPKTLVYVLSGIGGFIFLLLTILIIFCILRMRNNKQSESQKKEDFQPTSNNNLSYNYYSNSTSNNDINIVANNKYFFK